MSTLNVSMPDAMRAYVESRAGQESFSASEYVRYLIREDQKNQEKEKRGLLWDYLSISAKQLDDGDFSQADVKTLLAEGRARRRRGKPA